MCGIPFRLDKPFALIIGFALIMVASTVTERTPLLRATQDAAERTADVDEAETFEEVQARAEAVRESLPMSMVIPSLIAVFSGLFIAAIDSTLVVALIGSISSTFQAADRVFWLSSAYLLTMCAFAPIWGRLSDVLGRKVCLLWAVSLFGVGTLLCTFSPTMNALILARGVQGIGAAGIQPSTAIVINDLIPMRSRGIYQAIAQLVFSMGYALGGPAGGFLNDTFGWRFSFTVQMPPILLSLILLSLFLKLPDLPKTAEERARLAEMQGKPLRTILWSRLDPFGTTLLVASVVTMLLSLSALSAYDLDWSDSRVWGGLLAAAALLVAFLFVEMRVSAEPLVPLRILRHRSLASIWIIYFVLSFSSAILFYFPFYFLVIMRQTSTQVGLHYLPVSVATMVGSFTAGFILRRTGKYRTLCILLSILSVATPVYLITWTDTNMPSAIGQNVVLLPSAFGGAALNTLLLVALMAIAGQQDTASAVSLLYFFRALGSITGTSTLGSIIQKILIVELGKRIHGPHARTTIDVIRKDIGKIASLPQAQQQAARESYSIALRVFHIIIAALTVLVVITVFTVQDRSMGSAKAAPARKATPSDEGSASAEHEDGIANPTRE